MKKRFLIFSVMCLSAIVFYRVSKKINWNFNYEVGQHLDSLNNVIVYYNGGVDNASGRNTSSDGYNIGIKYQCVEFVKRYYYEHLNHTMPGTYGHAKDFYNPGLNDGELNKQRNLMQYKNGSNTKPKTDDLVVFSSSLFNAYGHVAIISSVNDNQIELIQQNPGPFGNSRETIKLKNVNGTWTLEDDKLLGWLRKK